GVNTGALSPVGGGKAMVGGGTKDEAIRDHNSVHAPAEFEAPTGCHEHPSNGWYMIIPAFIDHFFDEGVPAFFAVAFGILPNFVNSPLRVMVVMRPAGKSSPSGPLDRYLIRKEHAPIGGFFAPRSLDCKFCDHLPNGGGIHEFLRRPPVPRVSGAVMINPP